MSGCLALAWRNSQRAASGTQKTFSAGTRRGLPDPPPGRLATRLRRLSSKASEMYFRKIRPRTTCLYSAASRWPRSLSAACHSFASKPRSPLPLPLLPFARATSLCPLLVWTAYPNR